MRRFRRSRARLICHTSMVLYSALIISLFVLRPQAKSTRASNRYACCESSGTAVAARTTTGAHECGRSADSILVAHAVSLAKFAVTSGKKKELDSIVGQDKLPKDKRAEVPFGKSERSTLINSGGHEG